MSHRTQRRPGANSAPRSCRLVSIGRRSPAFVLSAIVQFARTDRRWSQVSLSDPTRKKFKKNAALKHRLFAHYPARGSRTTFAASSLLTIAFSRSSQVLSACALRSSMSLRT
jgi:hypothetical protein